MKLHTLQINPYDIDPKLIWEAAQVIRDGGLVAFPTETVYGLGANALNPEAVAKIFEAKKRPLDDPLIVHIADKADLSFLAAQIPPEAEKLIERFWPGPLTLVLKKTDKVPDIVTTGLDTVAVRMPSNSIARELIRTAGVPIAAPSANLFGRPSPTTAEHVGDDLDGAVDMILDGGKTQIGVESTVVELIEGKVIVLRPGGIDVEDLEQTIGQVHVYSENEVIERSPGKYPTHYSPRAKVVLIANDNEQVKNVLETAHAALREGHKVGVLAKTEHISMYLGLDCKTLGPENDARMCASELFHVLREFDKENVDIIVAEAIREEGIGLAVMNRLRKASG